MKRSIQQPTLVLLCLSAAVAFAQRADPVSDRFSLAIVRRDGIMLPCAGYDGNRWSTPWPTFLQYLDVPITLDAVPARWWGGKTPADWTLWLPAGGRQRIQLIAPTVLRVQCQRRIGIRTDYRSAEPVPPMFEEPFPKDGLAVSGNVPIEPIEVVDRGSADWTQMAVLLLPSADAAEEATLKAVRSSARWKHPVDGAGRRKVPLQLEAWYRAPMDKPGWSLSYVELVRRYPVRPEDNGCGLETFISGWVQINERPVETHPTCCRWDVCASTAGCTGSTRCPAGITNGTKSWKLRRRVSAMSRSTGAGLAGGVDNESRSP
ncbi:MAG: hypothetical protein LC804_10240 [Acidobacteria bacterium]|nr:hypothetical protein [Acidobacteriota bacterium]